MVYQHILIASGGAAHSRRAEERAVKIARAFEARLTLISVVRSRDMPTPVTMGKQDDEKERLEQEGVLIAARDRCEGHGLRPDTLLKSGDAGKRIVETAKELGCDLVVVGSRRLSMVGAITRGSVSDYVARHADGDVLIVH